MTFEDFIDVTGVLPPNEADEAYEAYLDQHSIDGSEIAVADIRVDLISTDQGDRRRYRLRRSVAEP